MLQRNREDISFNINYRAVNNFRMSCFSCSSSEKNTHKKTVFGSLEKQFKVGLLSFSLFLHQDVLCFHFFFYCYLAHCPQKCLSLVDLGMDVDWTTSNT